MVGKTCAALRAATLSSTASQLAGVPPSPKMFGMVLFCTTSPEINVRSGSTKVSFVAFGVGSAEPEQAGRNTAKIDQRFLVEKHIGRAQYNARQQLFILRRALAEHIDHLLAVLLHFLLLQPRCGSG